MTREHTLIALLAVVALAGCQYDPWADGFLKRQPSEQDVVGFYAVDQASQQRPIKLGASGSPLRVNPSAQITLSPDHRASFLDVPAELNGTQCSITGRGTWHLGKNGSFVVVRVQIADEEPNSRCRNTFTTDFGNELDLYGRKPPYRLHVTIGDPDSGDAIQFERRK